MTLHAASQARPAQGLTTHKEAAKPISQLGASAVLFDPARLTQHSVRLKTQFFWFLFLNPFPDTCNDILVPQCGFSPSVSYASNAMHVGSEGSGFPGH